MTINYTDLLYGPVYEALGVTVSIALSTDEIITLIALDKTTGLEVTENHMEMQTIKPVAIIRMRDLAQLGHAPEELVKPTPAIMHMNGDDWYIQTYYVKASPNGAADGEVYLILNEKP